MPAVDQLGPVLRQRVGARLLDDRGDHGRLRHIQLGHLLAVVRLSRRLDPVGAVTEVDRVQVVGEDPLLGLLLGHLHGHEDLLDLAAQRLLGADAGVVLPDELLGDGRAALQRAVTAPDVLVGGPHDARGRDAALVEEVPVLGGEHRVDEGLRLLKLGVGQHLPVGGAEPADEGAVARVDHGLRVAGGRHRRGGNRRLLIDHDHRDGAEHDDGADRRQQHAHGLLPRPVPPPAALDLDPGPVQPAAPRSAEAPGASRSPRPAGSGRSAWAAAAAPAAWRSGAHRAPVASDSHPSWLVCSVPAVARARGCRPFGPGAGGRGSGRTAVPTPPPAAAHRQLPGTVGSSGAGMAGLVAVEVVRFRDGGTLGCPSPQRHSPGRSRHPPRCPDSPRRPPGVRAPPCLHRDTERQSHQLCCSRVLAGGSEVAASGNATSTRKAGPPIPGTRQTQTLPPGPVVHWLVRARRLRRTAGSPVPRT